MAFDKQIEDLCAIYAEKTDDELFGLHEQRDDLTDAAQQALAQVMRERKLTGVTAPPIKAGRMTEVKTDTVLADDEVCVWTFDDAFQAREALRLLTNAEIEHRVVDSSKKSGNAFSGTNFQLQLGVIVNRHDAKAARAVLHETMGLFPGPEGDDDNASPHTSGDLVLLSMFDRKDAFAAAQALGEAGISYLWRDGLDTTQQLPDGETVAIEVVKDELERATQLVEEKLSD
jgi:hypothetical protein